MVKALNSTGNLYFWNNNTKEWKWRIKMSNYEPIFESAIGHLKSGKDFYYFKSDKNVAENAYALVPKDVEDRADIILDILEGVWRIASYVSDHYVESEKDCNKCAWQKTPECFCATCVYSPTTKDCYLPN